MERATLNAISATDDGGCRANTQGSGVVVQNEGGNFELL